jgi:hypothetical protein
MKNAWVVTNLPMNLSVIDLTMGKDGSIFVSTKDMSNENTNTKLY